MAVPSAVPAARAATPTDTMPEGAEARLRGLWKTKHVCVPEWGLAGECQPDVEDLRGFGY